MSTLISYLTGFWGVFEPISAGILFLQRYFDKTKQRTSFKEFKVIAERAFELVCIHIERFGIDRNEFAPRNRSSYIDELQDSINFKNKSFEYRKGEIELFFLTKFVLPKKNRINIFLIISYYYNEGYLTFLPFFQQREKFLNLIGRKNTFLHYLSIQDWASKNHEELADQVVLIKKPNPIWNDKYKIDRAEDIFKEKPSFNKALDTVLSKGKITERTIFNLASSEKLIIVHKYGEGFGEVFQHHKEKVQTTRDLLNKAKKSVAKDAEKRKEKYQKLLQEQIDSWPRVPLTYTLEKVGFQKLFNNLNGVYVYPLSMIPEKYQKDHRLYFEENIIQQAEEYFNELKQKDQFVRDNIDTSKYVFLSHVVSISELEIYTKERQIEVSSKALSKMLLSSFLSKENSQISTIYINDLVRNIDFKYLINGNSQTGKYLLRNFEKLKQLLYQHYSLDIYKPITLITLTNDQIEDITDKLLALDNSGTKRYVLQTLKEKVDFYKSLESELNNLKVKKKR